MKFYVAGVDNDTGVFNGKDYDNIYLILFCTEMRHNSTTKHLCGVDLPKKPRLKVKNKFNERVITNGFDVKCFEDLEGCQVEFSYDEFQNVDFIKVLKKDACAVVFTD